MTLKVLFKIVPASRVTHAELFASAKDLDIESPDKSEPNTSKYTSEIGSRADYDETDVENLKGVVMENIKENL